MEARQRRFSQKTAERAKPQILQITHGNHQELRSRNTEHPLFFRTCVVRLAVFGIEIPAKDKNAGQRHHEKDEAKSQPDVPPENCQIEHRRKHGGDEEEEPGQRGGGHFCHDGTIFHM